MLAESFDDWILASHGHLSWELTDNPEFADITCFWANKSAKKEKDSLNSIAGGITRGTYVPHGRSYEIRKVNITIYLANADSSAANADEIKRRCLHEIGHALGITGHSPYSTDIMYYCSNNNATKSLSLRDKKTLCKLYDIDVKDNYLSENSINYDITSKVFHSQIDYESSGLIEE